MGNASWESLDLPAALQTIAPQCREAEKQGLVSYESNGQIHGHSGSALSVPHSELFTKLTVIGGRSSLSSQHLEIWHQMPESQPAKNQSSIFWLEVLELLQHTLICFLSLVWQ